MYGESDFAASIAVGLVVAAIASLAVFALSWTTPELEPLRLLSIVLFILELSGYWVWGRHVDRLEK